MNRLKNKLLIYIKLCRIHHWAKNLFLFLPLFFSGGFFEFEMLFSVLKGFFLFSTSASCVYILNDMCDLEKDRLHPIKKFRPLAAGLLSRAEAIYLCLFTAILSLLFSYFLDVRFLALITLYLVINIAYSFKLKEFSLIDIFIIAIGFILRILAGGVLSEVAISNWLYIMTFLLSVFIAIGKRRDDLLFGAVTSGRQSISGYNIEFINVTTGILCSVLIVSYLLYTTSYETMLHFQNKNLYLTSFFVILGIFRYLQIIFIKKDSGSPIKILFEDRFIQVVMLLWVLLFDKNNL